MAKVAIGHVDGDALLALGLEAVEQQREVGQAEIVLLARVTVQRGGLVFLDGLGVPKQSADQGGLAVIDGAAGDEAERTRVAKRGLLLRRGRYGGGCGCGGRRNRVGGACTQ